MTTLHERAAQTVANAVETNDADISYIGTSEQIARVISELKSRTPQQLSAMTDLLTTTEELPAAPTVPAGRTEMERGMFV